MVGERNALIRTGIVKQLARGKNRVVAFLCVAGLEYAREAVFVMLIYNILRYLNITLVDAEISVRTVAVGNLFFAYPVNLAFIFSIGKYLIFLVKHQSQ